MSTCDFIIVVIFCTPTSAKFIAAFWGTIDFSSGFNNVRNFSSNILPSKIIAILFFIGIETVPLWQSPNTELQNSFTVEKAPITQGQSSNILIVGTEEYTEIAFLFDQQGVASFVSLEDGSLISETPIVDIEKQGVVTSTYASEKNEDYVAATSKGWLIPFSLKYNVTYGEDNKRNILPQIIQPDPIKISDESISLFGFKTGEFGNSSVTAYVTENSSFIFHSIAVSEDEFMDQEESLTNSVDLTTQIKANPISDIQIDSFQKIRAVILGGKLGQ